MDAVSHEQPSNSDCHLSTQDIHAIFDEEFFPTNFINPSTQEILRFQD
jgi:hypothetical protein